MLDLAALYRDVLAVQLGAHVPLVNDDLPPLGDARAGVAAAGALASARSARNNQVYQPLAASERAARRALHTAAYTAQWPGSDVDPAVREA